MTNVIQIPESLILNQNLSNSEFKFIIVMITLFNKHNVNTNSCSVSQKLLAKYVNCSIRHIRKLVTSLKNKGYINVHHQYKDGGQVASLYEIPLEFLIKNEENLITGDNYE